MKGYLVVHSFISNNKFFEIYNLLSNAFKKRNVQLEIKQSAELCIEITKGINKANTPDFALFWDKDVYLAKLFENAKIPTFNKSNAINLTDSKILTALELIKHNVPIPKTIFAPKVFENIGYTNLSFIKTASEQLKFPMIIKEEYGSFGEQVYLANNLVEAEEIVKNKIKNKQFLMQQYINESSGKDLRINMVGGKIISSMLRINKNDFRSNIAIGGSAENYVLNTEEKLLAKKVSKIFNLDFCGIDILLSNNGPLVCEVNSNLHFKGANQLTGINLADKICDHVLKKINKKQ